MAPGTRGRHHGQVIPVVRSSPQTMMPAARPPRSGSPGQPVGAAGLRRVLHDPDCDAVEEAEQAEFELLVNVEAGRRARPPGEVGIAVAGADQVPEWLKGGLRR